MRSTQSVFAILLILIASAGAAFAQDAWSEYVYQDSFFAVSAPSKPVYASQDVSTKIGPVEYRTYTVDLGGDFALMAGYNDYKRSMPASALDGVVSGAVGTKKLVSRKSSPYFSSPGTEIEVAAPTYHVRARFYLIGSRLYQLMCVAPPDQPFGAGCDRFVASFRTLTKQPEKP
jgi:hypothetical protein